jgi:hypothetical protein
LANFWNLNDSYSNFKTDWGKKMELIMGLLPEYKPEMENSG